VAGLRASLGSCDSDDERSEEEESAACRKRQADSSRKKTGTRNDNVVGIRVSPRNPVSLTDVVCPEL
jgi:hypothetical protein